MVYEISRITCSTGRVCWTARVYVDWVWKRGACDPARNREVGQRGDTFSQPTGSEWAEKRDSFPLSLPGRNLAPSAPHERVNATSDLCFRVQIRRSRKSG